MQRIRHALISVNLVLALACAPIAPAIAASPEPAKGENGMVVTAQRLATQAGVDVLRVALDRGWFPVAMSRGAELQKDLLLLGVMLAPSAPAEPEGPVCDAGVPGESAPHKVWAVKRTGVPAGAELPLGKLFSSLDAAKRFIGDWETPGLTFTEYEVESA